MKHAKDGRAAGYQKRVVTGASKLSRDAEDAKKTGWIVRACVVSCGVWTCLGFPGGATGDDGGGSKQRPANAGVQAAPAETALAMGVISDAAEMQPASRSTKDPTIVWPLSRTAPNEQPARADPTEPPPAGTATPPPRPAASAAREMGATVTVVTDRPEQIRLVKDRSAIIHTAAPVTRAAITAPEIASVLIPSPREIVVSGKGYGQTQLTLWSGENEQKTYDVVVELDLPMLEDAIHSLAPQSRVTTRMFSGTLVLSGRVPDPLTAERVEALAKIVHPRVANHLNVGGVQQTLLRCTVAEVNKEAIRQLAVNWALGGGESFKDLFFANNLGQLNPTVYGSNGKANLLMPIPPGRNNNDLANFTYFRNPVGLGPNANFTIGFPRAELQFFIQALRDNNLFRILAEPNAVAVNGQEATFLSGGEFPIPVSQGGATAGAITIEYKQFGIQLRFTPTSLENSVIRLRVGAEVSDLVPAGTIAVGGLPVFSLTSRRVESTVDVGSGQTFAIGGLLSDRVQALSSKIPGLGDIPVLGALFSSVRYQRNETELVILVTPESVAPMDPHQVAPVPGQEMTDPNDFELFALGRLEGCPRPECETYGAPRHAYPAKVTPARRTAASIDLSLRGPWGQADSEDM